MTVPGCIEICERCGLSHGQGARLERLRRALPASTEQLVSRWPCVYLNRTTGQPNSAFRRDIKSVGAVRTCDMSEAQRAKWPGMAEYYWAMRIAAPMPLIRDTPCLDICRDCAHPEQCVFAFAVEMLE